LTDFANYKNWNPFVKELTGDVKLGEKIKVLLQQPDSSPMKFAPEVTAFEKNEKFAWKGKLFINGLFDGEHSFELQAIGKDKTLFTQQEHFSGILIPLLSKMIDTKTRQGFESMNQKLKEVVERES
jgi:hypothetical protein